ncbi:hypothetical protein ACIOFR_40345, partial [Kitasatospora sp. NPDC088346]
EILTAATGRRTARDIGFALGRGVFAVLLDIVRMDSRNLLHREATHPAAMAPSVAPRTPPGEPLLPAGTGPLPRRVPGVPGVPAGRGAGSPGGTDGPGDLPAPSDGAAAASGAPPNEHRAERTETTETTEKSTP